MLSIGLCAIANGVYDSGDGDGAAVGEAVGEGGGFHEVGEDTGIGGEASKGETKVFVDADYFFLVRGEFFCVALGGCISI